MPDFENEDEDESPIVGRLSKPPPDDSHLQPAAVKYEPALVPVNDERRAVRGARVCIVTACEVLETTVIPPEGDGPHAWIGAAERVEQLYSEGLITLKLALVGAAQEGAAGKSGTIDLGRKVAPASSESAPAGETAPPPPAPDGAREWLADVLRWAIADAQRAGDRAHGRGAYVVGHLLDAARLSEDEQLALYAVVSRNDD